METGGRQRFLAPEPERFPSITAALLGGPDWAREKTFEGAGGDSCARGDLPSPSATPLGTVFLNTLEARPLGQIHAAKSPGGCHHRGVFFAIRFQPCRSGTVTANPLSA